MHATTRFTILAVTDPLLVQIGWAAVRRGGHLLIVVSSLLPLWRQQVAPLEAATDEEYDAYLATLPAEEQARRAIITAGLPGLSAREALIQHRSAIGKAGAYEDYVTRLPIPEQRRRQGVDGRLEVLV